MALIALATQQQPSRLPRAFYRRDPVALARALLGQRLVHAAAGQRLAGLIVEVEAYLGVEDRAAHTFGGRRTARNETMYRDGGHAYVYFTYGMHHCLNVVASAVDHPVAVLIRALEPVEGLDTMYGHRLKARRDTDLCSGPGKLCQALGIDRSHDGTDLTTSPALYIERVRQRVYPNTRIVSSPRIGVDYAGDWAAKPLRFHVRGHAHVSKR